MVVNGMGGVLSAAGTPLITSLWFKESERITATSIILVRATIDIFTSRKAGQGMVDVEKKHCYSPLAHQTITTTKANQGPRDNPRDLEPNLRIQGPNLGTSGCKLRDPAYGPREHT